MSRSRFDAPWRAAVAGVLVASLLAACSTGQRAESADGAATPATMGAIQEFRSSNGSLEVTLTAAEGQVPFADATRWAMTYNGSVTGPTIRVRPGDRLSVTLVNDLSEPTSLHTHGLHVSPEGAGDNPFVTVQPRQSKTYEYEIAENQPAGTFWYHPHAHGMAAQQVAAGLSGALIVEDAIDDELAAVTTDRVLVLNDPPLSADNPNSDGGMGTGMGMGGMHMGGSGPDMMTQMIGRTGPLMLANGQQGIDFTPDAGKLERARIINATASSRLRITWTGASMQRLASEGGRLPTAERVDAVDLAPGERTEVILLPGSDGGRLLAQRLSNEGSGGPNGEPQVLARAGAGAGTDLSALPKSLTGAERDLFADDVTLARTREITLDGHMNPAINGALFDPNTINFQASQGTVEEWVIRNETPMAHPIHLHSWAFQEAGENGEQDVVEVPPFSERVIRIAFDDFGGTTVVHCHILDHEDTGMMSIIRVT